MTQNKIFTEAEIKKWANSTSLLRQEGIIMVKHYLDNLYHYFTPTKGGLFLYAMSSVKPYYEENKDE